MASPETDFRFCPWCATPLVPDPQAKRPRCPACGYVQYLNPVAVTAGVLLSREAALPPAGELVEPEEATHILLVRRTATDRGTWCIPCGYVEYDEEIRAATVRELREETGLVVAAEKILAIQSNFHNPAAQTIGAWFAVRYLSGELSPGDDADLAAFVPFTGHGLALAFPTDLALLADLASASTE